MTIKIDCDTCGKTFSYDEIEAHRATCKPAKAEPVKPVKTIAPAKATKASGKAAKPAELAKPAADPKPAGKPAKGLATAGAAVLAGKDKPALKPTKAGKAVAQATREGKAGRAKLAADKAAKPEAAKPAPKASGKAAKAAEPVKPAAGKPATPKAAKATPKATPAADDDEEVMVQEIKPVPVPVKAKPATMAARSARKDARVPAAGEVLSKVYKGASYTATMLEAGACMLQGPDARQKPVRYGSLNLAAVSITNQKTNAYQFWNLGARPGSPERTPRVRQPLPERYEAAARVVNVLGVNSDLTGKATLPSKLGDCAAVQAAAMRETAKLLAVHARTLTEAAATLEAAARDAA